MTQEDKELDKMADDYWPDNQQIENGGDSEDERLDTETKDQVDLDLSNINEEEI